jgi:hypothetical protein
VLSEPQVLPFDEPVNGLDPEGVRRIRDLIKSLAGTTPPPNVRNTGPRSSVLPGAGPGRTLVS